MMEYYRRKLIEPEPDIVGRFWRTVFYLALFFGLAVWGTGW